VLVFVALELYILFTFEAGEKVVLAYVRVHTSRRAHNAHSTLLSSVLLTGAFIILLKYYKSQHEDV
jgi:hypothetical protein